MSVLLGEGRAWHHFGGSVTEDIRFFDDARTTETEAYVLHNKAYVVFSRLLV